MILIKILLIIITILLALCAVVLIAPIFTLDFRNGDECHECIGCQYIGQNEYCENCYIYKRFKRYVKRHEKNKGGKLWN